VIAMQVRDGTRVNAADGPLGVISASSDDPAGRVTIRMQNGDEVLVPVSVLAPQPDGSFAIPLSRDHLSRPAAPAAEAVIPVIAEDLNVDKQQVPTGGVRVHKLIDEHDELISMPLAKDRVDIKRVVIGRDVDAPLPVRREGETIIVPVVEEVLVVEKRLRLKEELHITRTTSTEQFEQTVTLKREDAVIERLDAEGNTVREQVPVETAPEPVPAQHTRPRRGGPFLKED